MNQNVLKSWNVNLSVQLYVKHENGNEQHELEDLINATKENQTQLNKNVEELLKQLNSLGIS